MKRTLVIAALVAMLALGAGYLLGRADDAVSIAALPAPTLGAGSGGDTAVTPKVVKQSNKARRSKKDRGTAPEASTPAGAGPGRAPPAALPPADTPLADIRDELEQRARAGDARAACRLGHELMRCQQMHERTAWLREADRQLARAPRDVVDRGVDFVARAENEVERAQAVCAGIAMDDTLEGFDWLAEAAERGNLAAMATFVRNPQLPWGSWIAEIDRLKVYRERAPRYAQAAFDAGDPRVLGVLAAAMADASVTGGRTPGGNPLQRLVPTDDVRAYAYAQLVLRYFPPRPPSGPPTMEFGESRRAEQIIGRLEQTLSPPQLAEGRTLADELAATTFRDAQPRPVTPPREPQPTTFGCED